MSAICNGIATQNRKSAKAVFIYTGLKHGLLTVAKAKFAGRRLLHRYRARALAAAKRGGSDVDVLAHVLVTILLGIVVKDANMAFANA